MGMSETFGRLSLFFNVSPYIRNLINNFEEIMEVLPTYFVKREKGTTKNYLVITERIPYYIPYIRLRFMLDNISPNL